LRVTLSRRIHRKGTEEEEEQHDRDEETSLPLYRSPIAWEQAGACEKLFTSFSPKTGTEQTRGVMQDMENSEDSAPFNPGSYWLVFP